ncbi:hypothetical protein BU24DRAFT_457076 [Aaosphaeria arxii CBS 175.79]|uniref:HTH psq-type domain-containing protein n=1 Tax=Aaosphaeria arxii CBS 175.79 TaxID=1450172 RepID=A0A6A5Y6Y5_9PLEO|nr:uncharacterized protein BU24DRAFT_457076 [Aaosphaeria arxii CBS 175.79]KAF2021059.1 hypothetical protein BU24DRAFT_457076 [Aaosphaeria arxii CBS 175.79]
MPHAASEPPPTLAPMADPLSGHHDTTSPLHHHVSTMADRELSIRNAIAAYNADPAMSIRRAAQLHNVPRSTLTGRLKGANPHALAHQLQQRLTPEQEAWVVD